MGRPGAGSGGSGFSSGGHSSMRSSGGHHVGGSFGGSRPGGGSSYHSGSSYRPSSHSFGGSSYHSHYSPPPPPPTSHYHTHYDSGGYYSGPRTVVHTRSSGCGTVVAIAIVLVIAAIIVFSSIGSVFFNIGIPASTKNREPIESAIAYQNDCVVDEIGWIENVTGLEKSLKIFYDKTGIQPYILMKSYDATLVTDEDKEQFANDYYEKHIKNEDTFLYVYFGEDESELVDVVGYMCYVNGKRVSQVMDSEAIEIFWAYIDNNWYSDKSMTDVFKDSFNDTADTIMKKSTTKADVGKSIVIAVTIAVVGTIVIVLIRITNKRAHEKAEETAKILSTPLDGDSTDDLINKYTEE